MSWWPFRSRRDDLRNRAAREIDDELSFHFANTAAELEARGLDRDDARVATARRFGPVAAHRRNLVRLQIQAEARIRRRAVMEVIKVSLRFALRGVRSSPGFAAGVVVILALGLGANAITFGLVDRLILSGPAGVERPEQVHRVVVHHRERGGVEIPDTNYSYQDYRDLLQVNGLAGAAGEISGPQLLGSGSTAERVRAKLVTANYFSILGVQPVIGRFFTADESEREGARLVVLGYSLWQRRYAGDPGIVGQVLPIGGGRYTVVGVAPRNFTGSSVTRADIFLPLEAASDEQVSGDWQTNRGLGWMSAIVRLAPGVSSQAAAAQATGVHRRLHDEEAKTGSEGRIQFVPLTAVRGLMTPGDVTVAGLAAAVALLVLVIAVANVANLFLARSLRRRGELAVKVALGSGRGRMIAEQAVEGALLATAGAGVAAIIAVQGGRLVQRMLFPNIDWLDTTLDLRGLLFVVGCAVVGGGVAAGLPVWIASRADAVYWLKSSGQRVGIRRTRTQLTMLVVQGALSVLLLIGAGLFVRSLAVLRGLDLGMDANRLLTIGVAPGEVPVREAFMETLRQHVQQLPGVERTALVAGTLPFVSSWATTFNVPDLPDRPRVSGPYVQGASPEYFATTGTKIIYGRRFTEADRIGAPLVVIVNEAMARLYWPGQSALGKCLQIGPGAPPCSTIVGITENTRRNEVLESASLLYYVPLAQAPPSVTYSARRLVVRVGDNDSATLNRLAESIRREALALEPSLRYVGVQPLAEVITPQLRAWQLGTTLFGAFGVLALLVAAVGLYSVVAFDVEGRRHEMGLRAALGASSVAILRLMMIGNLRVAGGGIVLGLAIAWATAPLIGTLLYGVSPHDAGVFAGVATVLLLSSAIASLVPALRAARIDPGQALRDE